MPHCTCAHAPAMRDLEPDWSKNRRQREEGTIFSPLPLPTERADFTTRYVFPPTENPPGKEEVSQSTREEKPPSLAQQV